MTDEEAYANALSDPDNPPSTDEELASAWWLPPGKSPLSLRLDADVLDWFRKSGPRYQTRINAVLRAYMNQRKKTAKPRRKGAKRSR